MATRIDRGGLTAAHGTELRRLIAQVPPDAAEDDPAFIRLCERWREIKIATGLPWDFRPSVPAYRARGRAGHVWITGGVGAVLAALTRITEAHE